MRPPPSKTAYYFIEGANSFATAYYLSYLLFLLRDRYGFGNLQNLAVMAGVGALYIPTSLFGGRFGQKHGYFASLRVGFAGLIAAVGIGWLWPSLPGIFLGLAGWSVAICFTWPVLEALVSEGEDQGRLPNRVGLYNVVWSGTQGLAQLTGGWLFERLGASSLFWLPVVIHLMQLLATVPLKKRHDAWRSLTRPQHEQPAVHKAGERTKAFQKLAWIANPLAYMAVNTVIAVVPGIAAGLGMSVAKAGALMSTWQHMRTLSFAVLWRWPGWHYNFRWFMGSYLLLVGCFVTIMLSRVPAQLVLAQVGFGWASALIYYSSLYYAMDGSDSHGEHGGIHEALIGIGICGGPAISAVTLWLTGTPFAPAIAMGTVLSVGAGLCWRAHLRPGR